MPRAAAALRDHRERQRQERARAAGPWRDFGLVFASEVGGPIEATNLLRRSYRPLLAFAGLAPITFHELRGSVASLLLEDRVHPAIVAHARVTGATLRKAAMRECFNAKGGTHGALR